MKKLFLLIVIGVVLFSCKKEASEGKQNESVLIQGEFIFIDDAAVIKGKNFIYGVEINEMTLQLSKQTKNLKREEYDMVPVVVNGIIKPNPEEGWEEIVEIKEIISVSAPITELPTKIKSSELKEEPTNAGAAQQKQ